MLEAVVIVLLFVIAVMLWMEIITAGSYTRIIPAAIGFIVASGLMYWRVAMLVWEYLL